MTRIAGPCAGPWSLDVRRCRVVSSQFSVVRFGFGIGFHPRPSNIEYNSPLREDWGGAEEDRKTMLLEYPMWAALSGLWAVRDSEETVQMSTVNESAHSETASRPLAPGLPWIASVQNCG